MLQRGTATRRDRQQGSDHADAIRGRHQPVTLREAEKLCRRAVQRWESDRRESGLRIGYYVGVGEALPYESAGFDAVVCVDVL